MSRIRIKRTSEEPLAVEPVAKRPRTEPITLTFACFPSVAGVRSAKITTQTGTIDIAEPDDEWSEREEHISPQVVAFLARTRPQPAAIPTVPMVSLAPPTAAAVAIPPGALTLRSGQQMYAIRHAEFSADQPPFPEVEAAAKTLMAPFAQRWFVWKSASEIERRTATRAGVTDLIHYIEVRNSVISAYARDPRAYLTVRAAREQTGESDISFLVRVWAVADYLGLINFCCDVASVPRQAKRLVDWGVAEKTADRQSELVQCGCCQRVLHYAAHFAKTAEVTLCTRCFAAGRFPAGLTEDAFERVEDLAMDSTSWTEEETLTLLEAIERFGEHDWSAIAAHVKKPMAECLVHFASLPIEERFSEPIGGKTGVFGDLDNPLMTLLSFLSSTVHPVVASAAAKRAFDAASAGVTVSEELVDEAVKGASEVAEKLEKIEKNNIASLFPKIIDLQLKKLELKHIRLHKLLQGGAPSQQ
jgi:hypothetical protein